MKRLFAIVLIAAGVALAAPASADDPAPTHRKHYYTPQYRSEPARRAAPVRREPAHQRSHHRSAGPVRKVWRKREWWQYHDQDEIVIDEDDGIVIEEDDGIVVDEDE